MSCIVEAFHMPFTRIIWGQSVFPGGPGGRNMPKPTGKREQVKRPGGLKKPDKAQLSTLGKFRKTAGASPNVRRQSVGVPEQ